MKKGPTLMAPLTKLYFTGAEKDQFLATVEQDYPSLQLSATQVQDDEWFLIVRIDGQFVATISSPLQFEALVAAAFAIVGDVMPQEYTVAPVVCVDCQTSLDRCNEEHMTEGLCGPCATRRLNCDCCGNPYIRASLTKVDEHGEVAYLCGDCLPEDEKEVPQEEGCEQLFPRALLKGCVEPMNGEMFVFCPKCRGEDLKATGLVTKPDLGKDQYIVNYILAHEKTPAQGI